MKYIIFDEKCRVNKEIKLSKFTDTKTDEIFDNVESIVWEGNIKPEISKKTVEISNNRRYEEIQLLSVKLKTRDNIQSIARIIYKSIKYPCIIEFNVENATSISADSFSKGKNNSEENVDIHMFFSHWLRRDFLSNKAKTMIESINQTIMEESNIGDIVSKTCNHISYYRLGGISKERVKQLITDMVGSSTGEIRHVMGKNSVPSRYYPYDNIYEKYNKSKRKKGSILVHDLEELWYCFMMCRSTRLVIKNRRYRDVEDLIYTIESKYCKDEENY